MTLKKIFSYALLALIISACTEKPSCMVADNVKKIENEALSKNGLHLYLMATGLNEKEHFYELYKGVPTFDECGNADISPVAQAHIDTTAVNPEKIIITSNQIEIEYTAEKKPENLSDIAIIID